MESEIKLALITDDGNLLKYNIGKEDYYHSKILSDYVTANYKQEEYEQVDLHNANSMSLFLREHGDIVFLNITTYINSQPSKHGRIGIFIMPDELSDFQKNTLQSFKSEIENYNEINVWYDFSSRTSCQLMRTDNKDQVMTIIDDFLSKNMSKRR